MTDDTLTRAKAILPGLTEAQRRWLKEGAHGDISISMVRKLIRLGLWYIRPDSPNGQWGFAEPTPLGIAVRELLAERASAEVGHG